MHLTDKEAQLFLNKILRINDVEKKFAENKHDLLKEIMPKFQEKIPFQNLSLLATNFSDRSLPKNDSIRDNFLSGIGGICYSTSTFVEALLKWIGYRAFRVACTIPYAGEKYTHIACVVTDVVKSGDNYLVDVAASFPSFEPVPLDDLPLQYHHAFHTYKFERDSDGSIGRYVKTGKFFRNLPASVDADGWQKFYEFRVIPRDDDFLNPYQVPVYTLPDFAAKWYLKGLRMTIYPAKKAITINDYVLKLWDEESNELKVITLKNSTDLENAIREHFPCLNGIDVQKAVSNWNALIN